MILELQTSSGMQKKDRMLIAPFRGITYKPWRNAFARHFGGSDEMFAPFISGSGIEKIHHSKLRDLLPLTDNVSRTVPQIISTNPDEIAALGNILADNGYIELNWNLGCPFARIANKKRGCGILPYPEQLDKLLSGIFNNLQIKLSVKTRLGYHHPDEIMKVLPVFNKYPVKRIILHTRTGKQGYKGKADPKAFFRCIQASKHPLVYNGDIYNHSQYQQLKAMFPQQNSWMIGRGALINPFLPSELKGMVFADREKRNLLESFHFELWHEAFKNRQHENMAIGSLKAVWHYMAGVFTIGNEVFTRIKRAKTRSTYLEAVDFALQQAFANEQQLEDYFYRLSV